VVYGANGSLGQWRQRVARIRFAADVMGTDDGLAEYPYKGG